MIDRCARTVVPRAARLRARALALLAATLVLSAATGCEGDGEDGEGELRVTIWGEEFIAEGIPADDFADGWSVTFDRFLVSVGELSAQTSADAAPAFEDATFRVYDLTQTPTEAPVASGTVPAGAYAHVDYTIGPSQTAVAGNATAADVEELRAGGYGVWVEGTATRGTAVVRFAWGFTETTRYTACHSTAVVPAGGATTTQLTIHGDHFFYDDLADPDAALRFAALAAADGDDDGTVTRAELHAIAGTDFVALDNYGVGDAAVADLDTYIAFLVGTLGHIDGEGHCGE